tara:strand:- start:4302 stop:5351 length:1050 start_codon:yes stop_codon:yes gene_type:complete
MELVKQVKCPYPQLSSDATNWLRRKRLALREMKEGIATAEDFDGDFYKKTKKTLNKKKSALKNNLRATIKRHNSREIKKLVLIQDGNWICPFNVNTQMRLHTAYTLRRNRAIKSIELKKNILEDYDIFAYKISNSTLYKNYWNMAIKEMEPSTLPLFIKNKKRKDLLIRENTGETLTDSNSDSESDTEPEVIEVNVDEDTSDYIDCDACGDTKMVKGTKCILCPILGHKEVKEHTEKEIIPTYADKVMSANEVNEVLKDFETCSIATDKTEDYDTNKFCYNGGRCRKWDCKYIHPEIRQRYFCRWGSDCVRYKEGRCKFIHNPEDKYKPLTEQAKKEYAEYQDKKWNKV